MQFDPQEIIYWLPPLPPTLWLVIGSIDVVISSLLGSRLEGLAGQALNQKVKAVKAVKGPNPGP